jgi:hypothetical protein
MKPTLLFAIFCLLSAPAFVSAQTPYTAHELSGKRVLWLGDSITNMGVYVSLVEYFLDKDYPADHFDIISVGLSGEIVAKLDPADQPAKHRCVLDRLGPALAKVKPDVVFACYGMNDGLYTPGNPRRLATFMAGVHELIDRCHAAGVKQVILITPPIFDPTPVKPAKRVEAGQPDADYGFNHFYVGYDAVLADEAKAEIAARRGPQGDLQRRRRTSQRHRELLHGRHDRSRPRRRRAADGSGRRREAGRLQSSLPTGRQMPPAAQQRLAGLH